MELSLILVKENELSEIERLANITWNDYYPAIVGQAQVDYMLKKMYSLEAMLDQIKNQHQQFYFIMLNENKIGFLGLSYNGEQYETFIHKFYILSQNQKSGLGTKILKLIGDLFPSSKSFRLTVNRQNFKSINFYFKNGFKIESVADFDIGNGYFMNDFIMVKQLG